MPDVEASVVRMLGDEENLVVVNVVAVGWLLLHVHLVFRRPEELVPKMCHALHVDKFIVGSILVAYICMHNIQYMRLKPSQFNLCLIMPKNYHAKMSNVHINIRVFLAVHEHSPEISVPSRLTETSTHRKYQCHPDWLTRALTGNISAIQIG